MAEDSGTAAPMTAAEYLELSEAWMRGRYATPSALREAMSGAAAPLPTADLSLCRGTAMSVQHTAPIGSTCPCGAIAFGSVQPTSVIRSEHTP